VRPDRPQGGESPIFDAGSRCGGSGEKECPQSKGENCGKNWWEVDPHEKPRSIGRCTKVSPSKGEGGEKQKKRTLRGRHRRAIASETLPPGLITMKTLKNDLRKQEEGGAAF